MLALSGFVRRLFKFSFYPCCASSASYSLFVSAHPTSGFLVYVSPGAEGWSVTLDWSLFLDDAPPVFRCSDILKAISEQRRQDRS